VCCTQYLGDLSDTMIAQLFRLAKVLGLFGAFLLGLPFLCLVLVASYDPIMNHRTMKDLTQALEQADSINLRSITGGDLICAFPPKINPMAILPFQESPFASYSSNVRNVVENAGIWCVVAIDRSARTFSISSVQDNRVSPDFSNRIPCGRDLAISGHLEGARKVYTFQNVQIEDLRRGIKDGNVN
jgi:hypothetical protein